MDTTKPFSARWTVADRGTVVIDPADIEEDMSVEDLVEMLDDLMLEKVRISAFPLSPDFNEYLAWARAVIAARTTDDPTSSDA